MDLGFYLYFPLGDFYFSSKRKSGFLQILESLSSSGANNLGRYFDVQEVKKLPQEFYDSHLQMN